MYKFGCYGNDGEPEVLGTAKTREEARKKYQILKKIIIALSGYKK